MLSFFKLFIMFWIFFILFIPSSMLVHHTNEAVGDGAVIAGVSADVNPVLNMIGTVFELAFGIAMVGLVIAMIVSALSKRQPPSYGGQYYER